MEGVDLIGELLARWKVAKILVTSRERIQLKEEWLFDVEGLRCPEVDPEGRQPSNLADFEAGRLFLVTAQRAKAEFMPEGDDAAQIARICRLVSGMPLAIELAASWVRLLPCTEIARGIAHDLEMLTTSWRDVPERHRSIQAALDYSWNLLALNEQDAFRRLTVFSGAFPREAAAAVAGMSQTVLLALVDKSFLRRTDSNRFSIHELIKQYGRNKLQADSELWAMTQLRHCRYFADLLIRYMSAPDAGLHLGELESLFDDLQMAWRNAVENRQLDQLRQLAEGFSKYYQLHSWYRAGASALALYRQALACFDPNTQNPGRQATLACLHESIGELLELSTAYEDARAAFQKALDTTADDDYIRRGRLYGKIADAWLGMNEHEPAHETYTLAESVLENALQRDAAWWHEWLHIQTQRMELYYWQNRPTDMATLASRIGPLFEQHGSVTQRLRYLYTVYLMALRRDRFFYSSDAIVYSAEALALSLETGNLREIAYRYFTYGFSCLWSDRFDEAERHLQVARGMMEKNGDLKLLARALTYLTLIYRRQGDIERVREFAALSLDVAGEANLPQFTGSARAHCAWLAWRAGDLAETQRQAWAAIDDWGGLVEHQTAAPYRWYALFPLMDVALQEANIEDAVQYAWYMITPSQVRLPDELTASLKRAVAAVEKGQRDAASDRLRHALRLARELQYI
jgi:tetratricopeptide (TPR) repeat protein